MSPLNRPIKNVVVLGATGNIGTPIVDSLIQHSAGFKVTVVTRDASKPSIFHHAVAVVETDYSSDSLRKIFTNQDAVVACVPNAKIADQKRLVDLAIEAGVARFIPSEFGMDTLNPDAVKWRPGLRAKVEVVDYLKSQEAKISWTVFLTGGFFDWALQMPGGGLGWDISKRKATIYDGGDVEWEASNLARIGEAVAAALGPEHTSLTANEVLYINSFTVSQNQILAVLEKVTGEKFEIQHDSTAEMRERANAKLKENATDKQAAIDSVNASILGLGGINQYSKYRSIWNEKLGLRKENLEESLKEIVSRVEKR